MTCRFYSIYSIYSITANYHWTIDSVRDNCVSTVKITINFMIEIELCFVSD